MEIPNKESIVWRVPEWIQVALLSFKLMLTRLLGVSQPRTVCNLCPSPMSYHLVLEYFATSPFYDRQSNNQVLKMQSQFNALGDLNQRLSSMRGIEFTVHSEHPPEMWIIRKQRRQNPEDGSVCVLNIIDVQWCRWHITLW